MSFVVRFIRAVEFSFMEVESWVNWGFAGAGFLKSRSSNQGRRSRRGEIRHQGGMLLDDDDYDRPDPCEIRPDAGLYDSYSDSEEDDMDEDIPAAPKGIIDVLLDLVLPMIQGPRPELRHQGGMLLDPREDDLSSYGSDLERDPCEMSPWESFADVLDSTGESLPLQQEKEEYLRLTKEDKRDDCLDSIDTTTVTVPKDRIMSWHDYFLEKESLLTDRLGMERIPAIKLHESNATLNKKLALWRGDISRLELDAIVNNATDDLSGGDGGGVNGQIHLAAGPDLLSECRTLNGCRTGEAKLTRGYRLPAKHVIHTVGPLCSGDKDLEQCYESSLKLMREHKLRTIAFPCISTGTYGFPRTTAAHIALNTVRNFLEKYGSEVDLVVFCLYHLKDVEIYETLTQMYFPIRGRPATLRMDKQQHDVFMQHGAMFGNRCPVAPSSRDDTIFEYNDVTDDVTFNEIPNLLEESDTISTGLPAVDQIASDIISMAAADESNDFYNHQTLDDVTTPETTPAETLPEVEGGAPTDDDLYLYDEDVPVEGIQRAMDFYPHPSEPHKHWYERLPSFHSDHEQHRDEHHFAQADRSVEYILDDLDQYLANGYM